MSTLRLAALALVSVAAGAALGAVLHQPAAPVAVPERVQERMPEEAPVRESKQARLDAGCTGHAWPYIPAECLERVAAAPRQAPVVSDPAALISDPSARTTTAVKTPVLRTASR